ncbi:phosphatidylinositol-specific phospholipase C1-like protein [Actinopolymorpha singaporensis]|uniref:phosphatidylinositol-specific phospholipase C1-like protein n=1 Tax=Actinopolymorpha singaporensis TaxID=117157 RepID=UPI001F523677|nr:phosphatidylinositol-specific phospholipase C1-like protein [Actinopolymorpha singaporensis]
MRGHDVGRGGRRNVVAAAATLMTAAACVLSATATPAGAQTREAAATARAAGDNVVNLNEIQTINTHNSYKRETSLAEQAAYDEITGNPGAYRNGLAYSHASLADQFEHQNVRGIELDLRPDPEGGLYRYPMVRRDAGLGPLTDPAWSEPGIKVFHVADGDYNSTCVRFVSCLQQVKAWSDAHPTHVPITIMLELKGSDRAFAERGGVVVPPWDAAALDAMDREIRSVFADDEMVTPDDVRRPGRTLNESVTQVGWPTLAQARGQVMFVFNNVGNSSPYTDNGHPNLEGRIAFVNAAPGQPNAAYRGRDEVIQLFDEIQDLVRRGYFVRTRSDYSLSTVREEDFSLIEASLGSGAQVISTDFPAVGMAARYDSDYVAQLPGAVPARCNPVNAPRTCRNSLLEPAN